MVHQDYKEMIPARALSALDAAEDRAMNEHLSECDECRRELAEWETVAASMALNAAATEPSPEVRERLLNQIKSEKSVSNVVPFPRRFGSLARIAAVVLFGALIVSVVVLWQQNRMLERENEFVKLLSTPGVRVAELSGTNEAAGASAVLAYDRTGHAMLVANGLPRAPGKEYQLWFIVGNRPPVPGKSFAPDNSGKGTMKDQVPAEALDSAVFAITLEPAGGVSAPTGAIYLRSGQ